jgi:prepilin signal peptidase PulO-like enzyme (type II secretory pathway)
LPPASAALAIWLGAEGTIATLLGAALIGLAEAMLRRRAGDDALPFGSFLCLAAWIVALIGTA